MAIDGDGKNDHANSIKLPPSLATEIPSSKEVNKSAAEQKHVATSNQSVTASTADLEQLWTWNQHVPSFIQRCMHDIVAEQARRQPQKIAVESWDGSLTYQELDNLSSQLARQILQKNTTAGSRIPLCFEKSMWTVVAVLAVMKAGATFSLTDPSQPVARLQTIVEQTGADLVITSVAQSKLGKEISREGGQVLAISRDYFDSIKDSDSKTALPQVSAKIPMYIIFTSGSTGKPKGVVITHANYTSGAIPRAEAVGYKQTSRCFDFPSYAFDVSIDCMLCTLAAGGQICVPSEEARMNDLSGAIRQSKANMVHMTPSVARVLDPDIIPSLDVLGLGGEAVSASDAAAWSQHTSLIIAYGPSECTVGCTINNTVTISTGIGKGVGGVTWIVDPDDHNILMPVGAVGELIIEGPVVGIGYLDEPEKTAQVFIEDPVWLTSGYSTFSGRPGRLYKTGDLVRYESNGSGSIEFVGRKDQQVKLRGQRVELAEVEHHLRACLPNGIKVAAEVIKPENGGAPSLVAFLSESVSVGTSGVDPAIVDPSPELKAVLATVNTAMGSKVPRYMVPAAFVTLQNMPSLVSGKTDRKKLREIGASIPREIFSRMQATESHEEEEPETETEKKLQQAWVKVLGSDAKIFRQSNFFALGGDSLRAMRLVVTARGNGIALTVADIFTNPTLSHMASKATQISESSLDNDIPPFSLLEKDWDLENARNEISTLCGVEASAVEDAYPCTPLQEALMALSAKVKEAYVAQRVVELKDMATAKRLLAAFDIAQQESPILRTRIVQVSGRGLVQAIIKERLDHFSGNNLNEYLVNDRNDAMELGKPLVRFAIIDDSTTGKVSFVLTIHHALYDGWSMPLVVDRVNMAYNDQTLSRPAEFKHFIKYLSNMEMDKSASYWREQLYGANASQFPPLPWQGYQPQSDSLLEEYVPLPDGKALNTTTATIIRAAWALVASQYINSADVIFGETLTGRNAPVVGSEEIEGPMITTVPVRVQIDRDLRVTDYLQSIQEQMVDQIPHEHFGLQHIRKLSPDAFDACELRTGLVLHPSAGDDELAPSDDLPASCLVPAGDAEAAQEALKFNTYALMLVCSIDPRGFLVMASFDSKTASVPVMQRALNQFKQIAQFLCRESSATLSSLPSLLADDDIAELRDAMLDADTSDAVNEYAGVQAAYVVSSNDPDQLVPVSAIGELIVQSLEELPGLTEISPPAWLQVIFTSGAPGQTKFYRTGRLAKYDSTQKPIRIKLIDTANERNATAPPAGVIKSRISASSSRQRKLRGLWARVLRMSEDDIGLNDGFFVLGGDSIAAMKLVSEARLEGVKLTVAQIFQERTLYEMANAMEEVENPASSSSAGAAAISEATAKPFSLLNLKDEDDVQRFVNDIIVPQLADPSWRISNVLPTRPLQQIAVRGTTQLPRFSARYEIMYFDKSIDHDKMAQSCRELVARNEILRTVFAEHQDEGYAVVLEELVPPVVEYAIDGDVEPFAKQLCRLDALTRMPLGSSFVKWFLVESSAGQSCLIFRLSHAQYDEICLPVMLQQLSSLYEDKPVQETVPFSAYVHHVLRQNLPESVPYWTDLLSGSSLTILKPDIPVHRRNHFAIQQTVDISSRLRDITVASLPTAAWALCLARRLSLRDVTFGEVVSGRNIDFPHGAANAITGPCWQYVPVRVRFPAGCTALDVLSAVQHQHIASSAHEGISLAEIATLCGTDWLSPGGPKASDLWFDSVVHQDVEHVEQLAFAAAGSGRLETVYPHEEPLREWKIQAFVHDNSNKLTLEIVTFESWGEYARGLLDDLATAVSMLLKDPHFKLFGNETE